MGRTHTVFVNLERLHSRGDKASLIIRLMMAYNDISLANQCLTEFREEQPRLRKHVQQGALLYFVRLQCGHLNEVLDLIQEIKSDQDLHRRVGRCSQAAQDAFKKLANCLKGGPDNRRFEKYIGLIRNTTAFHYDKKLVSRALSDRASRSKARPSRITMGDHINLCRFELADDIVDSLVCHQIWKIPKDANVLNEANRISDFGSDLGRVSLDFCGEFSFRYIQEHAAV